MGPSRSLNSSYISPSHEIIGQLHELDPSGHVCKRWFDAQGRHVMMTDRRLETAIFADEQILVGRDMRIWLDLFPLGNCFFADVSLANILSGILSYQTNT